MLWISLVGIELCSKFLYFTYQSRLMLVTSKGLFCLILYLFENTLRPTCLINWRNARAGKVLVCLKSNWVDNFGQLTLKSASPKPLGVGIQSSRYDTTSPTPLPMPLKPMDESNLEENTPLLPGDHSLETNKPDQLSGISPLAVGGRCSGSELGITFY